MTSFDQAETHASLGEMSFAEGSMADGSMADVSLDHVDPAENQSTLAGVQQTIVNSIAQYPLVCVGMAVATGMVLGCFVKRR